MRFTIFLFFVLISSSVFAQSITPEIITTGGGYYENDYASISITIGEPITETIDNGISLTQGFQQPDYNITDIEEINTIELSLNVYPNPATDFLTIKIDSEHYINLQIELYDISGKKLMNSELKNGVFENKINFSTYASGIYFLKFFNNDRTYSKTVKVEKYR